MIPESYFTYLEPILTKLESATLSTVALDGCAIGSFQILVWNIVLGTVLEQKQTYFVAISSL